MSVVKGVDFARLTLRDALDLAVLIEEEARDRYEELAEQMELHHTPEAANFFRFMSRNEEKHRAKLAARRQQEFGAVPRQVTRAMIFDIEAPEYDEARASMTVRAALAAALHSEKKAHAFFVSALPAIGNAEVRALFEELREEEVDHQRMVRGELDKAPADPELPPEAWEDEPTGQ